MYEVEFVKRTQPAVFARVREAQAGVMSVCDEPSGTVPGGRWSWTRGTRCFQPDPFASLPGPSTSPYDLFFIEEIASQTCPRPSSSEPGEEQERTASRKSTASTNHTPSCVMEKIASPIGLFGYKRSAFSELWVCVVAPVLGAPVEAIVVDLYANEAEPAIAALTVTREINDDYDDK
jgi:hypothetical protein